jgi:hypothetical protein
VVSFRETAILVEVVEDGGMDGDEFLQTSHPPKALHRPLSSSEWQVRILSAVVEPSTANLQIVASQLTKSSPIGWTPVRGQDFGPTMPLHQFPKHFQCGTLVSAHCYDTLKHLTFVIDSPPQIMAFAVDLHEDLVQVL